jgi:hypothetical protein
MKQRLAFIIFLDGPGEGPGIDNSLPQPPLTPGYPLPTPPGFGGGVDPGFGVRPPVDPGYGRPTWPHRPDNSLPGGPHYPTQGPVFPPVTPDNTLPPGPPPHISLPIVLPGTPGVPVDPDRKFELKYSPYYGWVLVPVDDGTAEPK